MYVISQQGRSCFLFYAVNSGHLLKTHLLFMIYTAGCLPTQYVIYYVVSTL